MNGSGAAELVRDAITGQPNLSAALAGWTVDLSDAADLPMPTKSDAPATAARITTPLAMLASPSAVPSPPRDDGAAAAGQDQPEDSQGIGRVKVDARDSVGGIQIRLVRSGTTDTRIVTYASQASVALSEACRMLHDRLFDKDTKMRENVVVCAGDPERDGLVLPLDVTALSCWPSSAVANCRRYRT